MTINDYCFRRAISLAFLGIFVLGTSACSLFSSRDKDSEVAIRKSLEIPPDLARPGGPEAKPSAPLLSATPTVARPLTENPGSPVSSAAPAEGASASGVAIKRDGNVRWLVVRDTPAATWKRIRSYFISKEIKLSGEDPTGFSLESDWADRPVKFSPGFFGDLLTKIHSSGLRDKYRVRIEAGRDAGTSEVFVSHRLLEEIVTQSGGEDVTRTKWFPRPGDPQMEAEFINQLFVFIGGSEKSIQVASVEPGKGVPRSDISRIENGLLAKTDDFDKVWRRIGLVLDRSGAIVEDQDRTAGAYYVQYRSAREKEKGLFSWFTSDTLISDPDKSAQIRYQVVLKRVPDGVQIVVNDVAGSRVTTKAAQELLDAIHKQY